MIRVAWSQLRRRVGRALVLLLGIVVAATSFTVLTGNVEVSRLQIAGTVEQHHRGQYDLLVRPANTQSDIERDLDLVRPNHLSGIFGGVTVDQYETIRDLPGIDIAAPIGMIGTFIQYSYGRVDVMDFLDPGEPTLLRIDRNRVADRGLTSIPAGAADYMYVTPHPMTEVHIAGLDPVPAEIIDGQEIALAGTVTAHGELTDPFAANRTEASVRAISLATGVPFGDLLLPPGWAAMEQGHAEYVLQFAYPFLAAAIDPEAEAQLAGLDAALVDGDYLDAAELAEGKQAENEQPPAEVRQVPVLVSSRPYLDDVNEYVISRLPAEMIERVRETAERGALLAGLGAADATELARVGIAAADAYDEVFDVSAPDAESPLRPDLEPPPPPSLETFWRGGDVSYDLSGEHTLIPRPVSNDLEVWNMPPLENYYVGPESAADLHFRDLTVQHAPLQTQGPWSGVQFDPVGRFDPELLRAFDELTDLPMEIYYPPAVVGADDHSRDLLGGEELLPTDNPAGYLQRPPLLLTTFDGAAAIADGFDLDNTAPISVIRVRVAGVTGPDPASRERVGLVAQAIVEHTGLDVDITFAASPSTATTVTLPAGDFGRPELSLAEPWVVKGAGFQILEQVDRKSLLLLALILTVCALFVFNAIAAAVHSRRSQLGVLACLGWPRRALFGAILVETGLIGVAAGAASVLLAHQLATWLELPVHTRHSLLAVPAALLLALLAALPPAWRAAHSAPAAAVRPAARQPRRPRAIRTITGLALTGLTRTPGRTAIAAGALAIGTAALTTLLAVSYGFQGGVVGSMLGDAIVIQARPADYAAAAIMLALAAVTIADVLYLNISERAPELAVLRSAGWTRRTIARLVLIEGTSIGVIGATAGILTGLLAARTLGGSLPIAALVAAAGLAAAAVALAGLAAALPAAAAGRLPIATVLTRE